MIHFFNFHPKTSEVGRSPTSRRNFKRAFYGDSSVLSFDNKSLNSPNIPFFHDKY